MSDSFFQGIVNHKSKSDIAVSNVLNGFSSVIDSIYFSNLNCVGFMGSGVTIFNKIVISFATLVLVGRVFIEKSSGIFRFTSRNIGSFKGQVEGNIINFVNFGSLNIVCNIPFFEIVHQSNPTIIWALG